MLADNALTTLDRMKLMLGLADIEDERTDEIITLLINRASSWIERQIGRHLGRHSYHQWYDADGQQELVLLEYPIISVEYVKQEGKIVDPETYDYAQTGEIGVIYRDKGTELLPVSVKAGAEERTFRHLFSAVLMDLSDLQDFGIHFANDADHNLLAGHFLAGGFQP